MLRLDTVLAGLLYGLFALAVVGTCGMVLVGPSEFQYTVNAWSVLVEILLFSFTVATYWLSARRSLRPHVKKVVVVEGAFLVVVFVQEIMSFGQSELVLVYTTFPLTIFLLVLVMGGPLMYIRYKMDAISETAAYIG